MRKVLANERELLDFIWGPEEVVGEVFYLDTKVTESVRFLKGKAKYVETLKEFKFLTLVCYDGPFKGHLAFIKVDADHVVLAEIIECSDGSNTWKIQEIKPEQDYSPKFTDSPGMVEGYMLFPSLLEN